MGVKESVAGCVSCVRLEMSLLHSICVALVDVKVLVLVLVA